MPSLDRVRKLYTNKKLESEMKVTASPPKKKTTPASLCSAAPSKGRGSRGYSLLPLEGGAPKGRRLDGESGMKESEGDRLKCVVYESTLSTADAVPLPQWGMLRNENTALPLTLLV